ncbi:MAG: hypothetical protein KDD53_03360 [Bdellovibrionales bacterium]|nr:hypothetical protein [Bdellovibrionales bacterium]
MQIITIEDRDFEDLLAAWKTGKQIGRYWRNGKLQVVCATRHFMLVSNGESPEKIAIKPTRSQLEAEQLCRQLLLKEEMFGNQVEFEIGE